MDDYSTFGNIDPLHTVHRSPTPGFDVQDYWHYKSEPIPVINFITGLTPELLRLMFEASAEEMEKKAIHLKIWGHIVGQALEQNKLTEEEINDIVVNNFNNLLEVITVLNEEELKELEGYASFYEAIKQIQDMMEQFNAKQLAKYEDESDLNNVDMENWLKQQRERKQAVAQNISEQNAKTIHIQKLVNRHLEHLTKEQEEEQHKGIEEEIKPIQLQRFPDHELEVTQMLEIPIVVYPRDVKLQVQSSNPEIATVKVEQQKLLVEALREGTVIIQIFAYKNGYQSTQSNFKVTVNASQGLPLAKNIYIPQDGFMRFANGVVLDVAGNTIGPQAQVNVREVTANVPATLQQAGKIVNITFENFTLTKPARLILPYQQAIDFDRIGVFHEESQGSWRFVPFTKTAQGLLVETSNFSTFGVFTAPKLNIPYASISGEVPKGTTIYLDANEFAQIFYSIDGSIPTEQSNLFTRRNPIVVDQAMTLKARAFANNYLPSDVAIYVYVLPIEYSVTFQVTDGTNPIAGATVKINDEIVMTDSTGVASFALPNGTYMYYIEKAGFQPLNGIYFTVEETDMTIPIVLQADEN